MTKLSLSEGGIICTVCGENCVNIIVKESKQKSNWIVATILSLVCPKCHSEQGTMEWSPQGKFYRWRIPIFG